MPLVYKYENLLDGKVYIGQTTRTLAKRAGSDGKNYSRSLHFYAAIQRDGWHNFEATILYSSDSIENLNWIEEMFIREYNATDREFGYNIDGGGSKNKAVSEETRARISEKKRAHLQYLKDNNIKVECSPETRAKHSLNNKGEKNCMYGKTHSPEARAKIAAASKRRYETNPESYFGHKPSDETRAKMSAHAKQRFSKPENNVFYGKHHSEESKQKIREAKTGSTNRECWLRFVQLDLDGNIVMIYENGPSLKDTLFNWTTVSTACKGHHTTPDGHTYKGYRWFSYVDYLTNNNIDFSYEQLESDIRVLNIPYKYYNKELKTMVRVD